MGIELPVMDKVCVPGFIFVFFRVKLMLGNSYMIVDPLMEPDLFIFSWIAMLDAFFGNILKIALKQHEDLKIVDLGDQNDIQLLNRIII